MSPTAFLTITGHILLTMPENKHYEKNIVVVYVKTLIIIACRIYVLIISSGTTEYCWHESTLGPNGFGTKKPVTLGCTLHVHILKLGLKERPQKMTPMKSRPAIERSVS